MRCRSTLSSLGTAIKGFYPFFWDINPTCLIFFSEITVLCYLKYSSPCCYGFALTDFTCNKYKTKLKNFFLYSKIVDIPKLLLLNDIFLKKFNVYMWQNYAQKRRQTYAKNILTFDIGISRFNLYDSITRVKRTINTTKAAFSKSVSCTSIERNSTRHPILLFGGGGLKRTLCQFVDWIF